MTAGLQPFLHDQVVLVSAPTMAICPPSGQLDGTGAGGLYTADRRVLSVLQVQVGGAEPEPIHQELTSANAARFVAVLRGVDAPTPDVVLRLERRRSIDDTSAGQVLTEVLRFTNAGAADVEVDARIRLGCDFADVSSVKDGAATPVAGATTTTPDGVAFTATEVPGWSVEVHADPSPTTRSSVAENGDVDLGFALRLPGGGVASIALTVVPAAPADARVVDPPSRRRGDGPDDGPATASSHDGILGPLLARSIDDLDRLVLSDPDEPGDEFYAAGAPWYLTMFGRDSLWTAWLALPLGVERSASTLRVLARRQSTSLDRSIAAEPGKILHELRPPILGHDTGLRLPPVYFGSIDSTPMWIRLLHRAWRWGMPAAEVRALLPNLIAAVGWLLDYSDADGDGLLEYIDESGHGLANQGWKDSSDSVQHFDGTLAAAPIALCEVQGYAYAAAHAAIELYEAFGVSDPSHDVAGIRAWAQRLAAAFHERFWVTDDAGSFVAIALDGQKLPVASVTSNPGHLLTSGLLSTEQIAVVAARLTSLELASGFGLRTMSDRSRGYNPLGYHTGSVWTHDTAIVIGELAASGRSDETWALVRGLLRAAPVFDQRYPELFSGESADEVAGPSPYPASCRPQAWAAAAGPALLTALLGLDVDVPSGTITLAPCGLADGRLDGLEVRGLRIAGGRLSVRITGTTVEVLECPSALRVVRQP